MSSSSSEASAAPVAVSPLARKIARFAPTDVTADVSKLPATDGRPGEAGAGVEDHRRALPAAGLVGQRSDADRSLAATRRRPGGTACTASSSTRGHGRGSITMSHSCRRAGRSRLAPISIPATRRKEELEKWIDSLPEAERARATGFFTVIRRGAGRSRSRRALQRGVSERAGARRAVAARSGSLAAEPTLKAFLTKRAEAFLSNDYYDSDVAWMELKGAIEPTIGPYEVYEDEYFNYKAAFESFITLRTTPRPRSCSSSAASCRTSRTSCRSSRRFATRSSARWRRIVVVNEMFAAGDGNRGVQTAALQPAQRRARDPEKGAKRVMLKNVQDAKFAEDADADLQGRRCAPAIRSRCRSTRSSRTS